MSDWQSMMESVIYDLLSDFDGEVPGAGGFCEVQGKMKRIPIDECPAGPEIDAAVAEVYTGPGIKLRVALETFCPSTDIAAAWELVEELVKEHSITINWLHFWGEQNWTISFTKGKKMGDWISTITDDGGVPLAITRAYLKAKGVEFVEVPE